MPFCYKIYAGRRGYGFAVGLCKFSDLLGRMMASAPTGQQKNVILSEAKNLTQNNPNAFYNP